MRGAAGRARRAPGDDALAIGPRELVETALGLLIATGRVDEAGGRLVPVSQEQRQAV